MRIKTHKNTTHSNLSCIYETRVRFNEVDSLGIVWHGNYLKYFEDGREAFGRKYGIAYLDIKKNGFASPIVQSTIDHKHPLKYGDVAVIETKFMNSPAAKIIFSYTIKNQEGQIVCVGQTTQVFTDSSSKLALLAPSFYIQWKAKMGLS